MLALMTYELQNQLEEMDMPSILTHLHEIYDTRVRVKCYEVPNALFGCKLTKGRQVGLHVVKMNNYIERLVSSGFCTQISFKISS